MSPNPAVLTWPRAVAVGASAIDPSSLSGRLWNAPNSALGADGAAISSWADGLFVQADAAKQPVVATLGGVKCASFDGGDILTEAGAAYHLSSNQTMFAVVRPGSSTGGRYAIGVTSGIGVTLGMDALKAKLGSWAGDWAAAQSAAGTLNAWTVISGRYVRGVSLSARLNDAAPVAVATTTQSSTDRRNQLGGNAGSASWIGGIAEAWNFSRDLSDTEWAGVIAFLKAQYSIA